MRPIVLSGFMATGKSTVGPRLAERLGVPFLDTDEEIERRTGRRVPDLWRDEGESAFRARETALVGELLADSAPRVLSFGGGTVTTPRARRIAIDHAFVVTLTASPVTIARRAHDISARPNLGAGSDPVSRARELLEQRADAYAECHLTVSTEELGPDGVVDAILALVARDPLLVPLGARSYAIDVGVDAPERLTRAIERCQPSSLVVVTDSNVQRLRGHAIEAALHPLGLRTTHVALAPGEAQKTLASVATIWDAALGGGVDRDVLVVAAGGGVVGDLAGFAAACLLRGVRFVQVPTTLLSMVDSSVGGKTGFDHAVGKNLIGAFHQPVAVTVDLGHLVTLPARERAAGLAEVVKIALATDAGLLEALERDAPAIARGETSALLPIVRRAISAKIAVVRDDERESGPRALLNLGHTVGHAIEAHGGYARWLHGEAVAIGTVAEMRACVSLGYTPAALEQRAEAIFAALGLPTRVDHGELAASWPFVANDKKRTRDAVKLPVVTGPGESHVERVDLSRLKGAVLAT